MNAWMRKLYIRLTSNQLKKSVEIGNDVNNNNLSITISVNKYMSSLKDDAVVKIKNMTQSELTQIIMGQFFDIEIYCGYEKGNVSCIFKGGVLHLNNKLNADRTSTLIILCASNMIAKFGQRRLNLTLNSGINLYSATKFILKMGGIPNSNVSTQLKKKFLEQTTNINQTVPQYLDELCNKDKMLIQNTDDILNNNYSLFDASKSNNRVIELSNDVISLTKGYPRLTSEGLDLTLLPTFSFMCGDTIKIDNAILDVAASSRNEVSKNYAAYINKKGWYMIFEMHYELQNRGSEFSLELQCKNREFISSYIGGSK